MNRETIIQMAREAGLAEVTDTAESLPADYVDALAKLCAMAVAKEREECGWQPIETAPKDGRLVLVYRPLAANTRDEPIAIKSLIGGDRFCWPHTVPKGSAPTNPTDGACHVTHWMPLPPPPSAIRARGEAL